MGNAYKTSVLYQTSDGGFFYSPDGVGRIFYDTLAEAQEDVGTLKIQNATKAQEEDSWSDN